MARMDPMMSSESVGNAAKGTPPACQEVEKPVQPLRDQPLVGPIYMTHDKPVTQAFFPFEDMD